MAALTPARPGVSEARFEGLDPEELIRAFRIMQTARRLDDREIALKRQNRIFFQISGAGHEAVQVAAGLVLRPGHDWFYLYYRDRALCLALGMTPYEMLQSAVGAAADPSFRRPADALALGPSRAQHRQLVLPHGHAVRAGGGVRGSVAVTSTRPGDEITLVSSGEGATSEGEFWEALNIACLKRLPLLFLIEDNGYAISVPVECQTAGGSISKLVAGFPGPLPAGSGRHRFSGLLPRHAKPPWRTAAKAAARRWCTRTSSGPTRTRFPTTSGSTRPPPSGRPKRSATPCSRFPQFLMEEGVMDRHMLQRIAHEIDEEVHEAAAQARSPTIRRRRIGAAASLLGHGGPHVGRLRRAEPHFHGAPMTMVDLINATLREEMRRNPKILVFGEDVADCTRAANLAEVKGKGGVFKATAGLQTRVRAGRAASTRRWRRPPSWAAPSAWPPAG